MPHLLPVFAEPAITGVLYPVMVKAQTKSDIRTMLAEAGLTPHRRLGQCFLIDGNLLRKLAACAELGPTDVVLEVGPGTGGLTELLLEQAGAVVAVEIDRGLYELVQQRLGGNPKLTLLHQDVLASKSCVASEVGAALVAAQKRIKEGPLAGARGADKKTPVQHDERPVAVKLAANLPYQIATPLLVDLLVCGLTFEKYCFSVQKEVAERLAADPGSKSYGPVSIIMQCCSDIHRIADLPPSVFWPSPAVDSVLLLMNLYRDNFDSIEQLRRFIRFVRTGFAHRRKTLHYHLKEHYPAEQLRETYAKLQIDPVRRPEQLEAALWLELFLVLED